LKEEALDRTVLENSLWKRCGPVVRQASSKIYCVQSTAKEMIPASNTTEAHEQDFVPLPILEAYAQGTWLTTRYLKCLNVFGPCVVAGLSGVPCRTAPDMPISPQVSPHCQPFTDITGNLSKT